MKTTYLITFIIILFTNIVYPNWIPRKENNKNANICDKLDEYVYSPYSEEQFLKYSDIKACYELTSYNKTKAIQLIETVKEYLKGFYALLDQAKEDPNPGFALRPIDLISELDLVLKNNYSYEYQFIYDVASLIEELRDGHTALRSNDYYKYTFDQGLSMYSVIKEDGTQQIKVFNDIKEPSNVDCQVIDIDGKPAIDAIIEFARDHTFNSRDLSARFNSALASLAFGNGDFDIAGQLFTYRNQLPKNPSISYTLNCNGTFFKITREWQVPIKNVQYKSPYISGTSVGNATLIFDAFIARFYILQDFGVVLISTEDINNSGDLEYHFLSNIIAGFKLFADKGIKKIILDLSNNGGGDVFIGHYINKLLFPNIQNFPLDYKVNDISIPFIKEISRIKNRIGDIFHYKSFLSANTKSSFDIVNDFIGNNIYTRGGVKVRYTSKAFLNDTTNYIGTFELPKPPKFPWTEKDIVILTNGFCQSSCAIITQRLAEINVLTIAVGGFPNTRFSFAQYAVGGAYSSAEIQPLLKLKNINSSLVSKLSLPSNLTLHFTLAEAYSIKNPNEVMDFAYRPADYQLYYDERSARDPSCLWIQAAEYFGK
ncbi:peptidase s41 family protein [Gigaspora margarita]|uniref:Peptidase s41 family protein n=1 Tax=Gigaspora margarita TaxID=4874 RepID=A0A8H4EK62_GIGMA|nr:peptidase s41 family protein [Gigaspora margarita]